jgi:hypothetical protein
VLFGILATLLPGLPWTIAGLAWHFAISGCSAGFIIGWCGPWFERESALDSDESVQAEKQDSAGPIDPQQFEGPIAAEISRLPSNRVETYMETAGRHLPSETVQDPLRN